MKKSFIQFGNRKPLTGFTLIELLVVIAVIGLLTSISFVGLNSAKIQARDAKRKADLKNIQKALEMYYIDKGIYPYKPTPDDHFFSVWDSEQKHAFNCWMRICPDSDSEKLDLYNGLVTNRYLPFLPLDPVNRQTLPEDFLFGGPSTDLGYIYKSENGKNYILGTNLEKGEGGYALGNYQLTGGQQQ